MISKPIDLFWTAIKLCIFYFAKKAMEVVEEKASVKEVGEEEASPWEEG